ncbi:unnamed protein product [Prunus armeniaca]|uniref:Uncharacterized protein n=1 Tax=Prunus armeniaca TaxID=36596 RepID=A0A6J5WK61_PRUAR|nr:unnamed protein product [Prunus armeniaca]CAB4300733.1 unnamed protein product [Prunus armeniaca]
MKSQNPTFILIIQLMQIWSRQMGTIQWHKVRIQWFKVDTLIHIIIKGISPIDGSPGNDDTASIADWPSKKDIGHLFEFTAYYVACGRANVSKHVLSQILEYLTSKNNFPSWVAGDSITPKRREKQVLGLLEVCGLIHTNRHQYLAALDCYMKDIDEPIHAFSFINKILLWLTDNESTAFQSEVIFFSGGLPSQLFNLNYFLILCREGTFTYLALDFSSLRKDDLVRVKDQSKAVEAYLERISDFPKLLRNNPVNVTDDMIELYLETLLIAIAQKEHCLRLCQKYGITDAASFLLGRVGDDGGALLLTLSTLNEKFIKLDTAMGSLVSSGSARTEHFSNALKLHKGVHILRKLFSRFIEEIVEGMIGSVRLPTIMSKLLSDNGSQEFAD